MNTTYESYLEALIAFTRREGHARVPVAHIELLEGRPIKLGPWVGYIRQRYRRGGLDESRAEKLAGLPGWEWGPLPPGPATKPDRDKQIMEMREAGLSLQQIADGFRISRQRVHQIVTGASK